MDRPITAVESRRSSGARKGKTAPLKHFQVRQRRLQGNPWRCFEWTVPREIAIDERLERSRWTNELRHDVEGTRSGSERTSVDHDSRRCERAEGLGVGVGPSNP
jgi:hypothetical protein